MLLFPLKENQVLLSKRVAAVDPTSVCAAEGPGADFGQPLRSLRPVYIGFQAASVRTNLGVPVIRESIMSALRSASATLRSGGQNKNGGTGFV